MAAVDQLPTTRRLILDAGAIRALARGDPLARAALRRAAREGFAVVIPTPVLAQVHRAGRGGVAIDAIAEAVGAPLPTSERVARMAGELMGRTGTDDEVQAIVAAEAIAAAPALILTRIRPQPRPSAGKPRGVVVVAI